MNKLIITSFIFVIMNIGQLPAQQYAAQDGHLLDANNRIGSMGWNGNARIDALAYRNNSMMTGNLTGGMSFQGQVPYASSRQFQGLSNSDSLSTFRRDSRSVNSLGVSGPQIYIDQARSVTGSYNGKVSGSYQGYSTSNIMNPGSTRTYTQQYNNSLSYSPQGTSKNFSLDKFISQTPAGSNNTFGRTAGPAGIASEALGRTGMGFSLSADNDNNLSFSRKFVPKEKMIETPDQTQLNIDTESLGEGQATENKVPVDVEEQMYMEGSKRIFIEGEMQSSGLTDQEDISEQITAKYKSYATEGTKLLKSGKYYNAIDAFELAKIYSKRNATEPLFNCMVARFAAGEYISSSSNLNNMFYISFEKTMQKRDLSKMFSGPDAIFKCLRDLSASYDISKNSSLLFLKGYIQYQNNELDDAAITYIDLVKANPEVELFNKILAELQSQRAAIKAQ